MKPLCLSSSPALRLWWWHLLIADKKGLANSLRKSWPVNHNSPNGRWYVWYIFPGIPRTTTWWFWRFLFWISLSLQLGRNQNDLTEEQVAKRCHECIETNHLTRRSTWSDGKFFKISLPNTDWKSNDQPKITLHDPVTSSFVSESDQTGLVNMPL